MIYTITTNPALDYYIDCSDDPLIGEINRTANARMLPGGKGINVSIVSARLGAQTCAMGFSAGKIGDLLMNYLTEEGCLTDFVRVKCGETRINTKIQHPGGETAFNGAGPLIEPEDVESLKQKLEKIGPDDDLVLSGNLQSSINSLYLDLIMAAARKNARVIVDTSGAALKKILGQKIFLVKPNLEELNELFNDEGNDIPHVLDLARKLQNSGCRNVLVSMGADGSILLTEEGIAYRAMTAADEPIISTVGAGDSLLAGFLVEYDRSGDFQKALAAGSAAGTGTACSDGMTTEIRFKRMLAQTDCKKIESR